MDPQRIQLDRSNSVYDWRHDILHSHHTYQDMDLYIFDLYMPNGLHIRCCLHIPAYS